METSHRFVARARLAAISSAALLATSLVALPGSATAGETARSQAPAGEMSGRDGSRQPQQIDLPAGIQPEGITSGPGARYYVGSLNDGRIVTGNLHRGTSRVLWPGETGRQLRGLYFDARTGLVWAAGNVGDEAHVWAVDARSGAVEQDTVVPDAVFLNDLVVTKRAVWVTDSRVDRLTRIALDRGGQPTGRAPTFVELTGEWPAGEGMAINANGIRSLPGGSLILNNSRVGGLWEVSRTTGVVTEIEVQGGPGIIAGDGLERAGRMLFNVRGSGPAEVSVLRLDRTNGEWSAEWVKALTDPGLDVPSTATLVGHTLWAVNARFGTTDPQPAPYWITPLPVRQN
jgi:hypothetical protein